MICESCKERNATVHLTQVVDGAVKKVHLCEECALKTGMNIHAPVSISDILLGLGLANPPEGGGVERTCPRCGMSRADFKKTGRFGCPECYEAFAEELPPLISNMHRGEQHIGKVPASESVRVVATTELNALQKELNKAVAEERFEDAARCRDRILECKARLEVPHD
jgi:protein arginine kinase activator